jgi:uncharacterized Zn finger protein
MGRASMEGEIILEARDARFLRAAQQVLKEYTIARQRRAGGGPVVFEITGGEAPYTVTVHPEWAAPPTCSCPDAQRRAKSQNAGYCKHIIAVLLSNEELKCQLLELFL